MAPAPAIIDFGGKTIPDGGTVDCASANSQVDIALVWSSSNATKAWTGIDIEGDDASTAPYDGNGVPTSSTNSSLPFSCSKEQHSFTLTVKNAAGKLASKKVTFVRALPQTSSSSTSSSPTTTPSSTTSSSTSSSSSSSTPSTSSSSTPTTPTTPSTTPATTPATS